MFDIQGSHGSAARVALFFGVVAFSATLLGVPAWAQTSTTVFSSVQSKTSDIFTNVRNILMVVGALGVLGLAASAFFGHFKWSWAVSLLGGLPKQLESLYFVQNIGAGLFTITAPTDNGKSTTLNLFCIDMVQARGGHIDVIGIDDPVEFMAPEICQLAMYDVGEGEDPFAQKIHTSLRLAPHAIKIGECRTLSTAEASIDAAVTGKLVMTTQHTTGAFGVPFRYERMGVSRHVAYDSSVHVCWMSQRLVPALCPLCRIPLFADLSGLDPRRMATKVGSQEVLI